MLGSVQHSLSKLRYGKCGVSGFQVLVYLLIQPYTLHVGYNQMVLGGLAPDREEQSCVCNHYMKPGIKLE